MKNTVDLEFAAVQFNPFAGPQLARIVPITEAQAEIWAACLVGGPDASRAYNESVSLRLTGPLDRVALEQALHAVVRRHEALRSAFSADGRHICVFRQLPPSFAYLDVAAQPETEKAPHVADYVAQDMRHLFDLTHGPLLKVGLLRLATEEHHLVLTAHHIVCDGWSLGIIMQELGQLYSAYVLNRFQELPAPVLFSDYAARQAAFEQSAEYRRIEQFWRQLHERPAPVLALPLDFPRPAVRTYQSARLDFPLEAGLVSAVRKTGQQAGCSLVTTLLAAFSLLLHRRTGQDDLVLGMPAAGQAATDNPQLVGHCVNLLPTRSQLPVGASFADFLKLRRQAQLDAYDHQQLTFGSLLKKLHVSRDASRIPLVPVVFNVDMGLADGVSFHGLRCQLSTNPRAFEAFELFLNASGTPDALTLEWSYNTTLFRPETIAGLMADFEQLLAEMVRDPQARIRHAAVGQPVFIDSYEALNDTRQPYPVSKPLHQLLDEQALLMPGKVAVQFGPAALTYAQLREQSNQLANLLIAKGVQPGHRVGVVVDRSAELLVLLLAVMKCGAAYVPLDPTYPRERLEFMLTDSGAEFLLTSAASSLRTRATTLPVEGLLAEARAYSEQAPPVLVESTELLYVIYTSGSTGKPKGVQITHRNMVNFLCSMQQTPGLVATDRLLAITTICFDIAGLELFLPLLSGATLVVADAATVKDGRLLVEQLEKEQITVMQATPATWRMMLDTGWTRPLPLKALCGGEALPVELASRLLRQCASLWNLYGPTETTVWSSVKQITATMAADITIGRPIANTQFYVLDEQRQPVEVGAVGELFIGGDGVAAGYWQRPALTAEKFLPNPFAAPPDARLYRTGDLGMLLPSGDIQYQGRADQQVKIRGHRIEPGEIEHALVALAEVREAVVLVRAEPAGHERLVAFVVPAPAALAPDFVAWRKVLGRQLPTYMVPSDFVLLPALPLTLNGKVDRKALAQQPLAPGPRPATRSAAPRTEAEKLIADVWTQHLGVEKVGVFDNFFELGGHSLVAVQVISCLERKTGQRLPMSALFEHSTVEKLAAVLESNNTASRWKSLVPIKPQGRKPPLYIVHGFGLTVFVFNNIAVHLDADQPVYGLQPKGLDGTDEPLHTVEEMAAFYVSEILQQNPGGPYTLAGFSSGGIIAYEMARQLRQMGKSIALLGLFDTEASTYQLTGTSLGKARQRVACFFARRWWDVRQLVKSPRRALFYHASHAKWSVHNVLSRMGLAGPVGPAKETPTMQTIIAINDHAIDQYVRCGLPPYDGELTLFRTTNGLEFVAEPKMLGWQAYSTRPVAVHHVPGAHHDMILPPHNQPFAAVLQRVLDQRA